MEELSSIKVDISLGVRNVYAKMNVCGGKETRTQLERGSAKGDLQTLEKGKRLKEELEGKGEKNQNIKGGVESVDIAAGWRFSEKGGMNSA